MILVNSQTLFATKSRLLEAAPRQRSAAANGEQNRADPNHLKLHINLKTLNRKI